MMDHSQIRKLRADLGISQAALARATGINRTVLSGLETGQLLLQGDPARRLLDYFVHQGVDLDTERAEPKAIGSARQLILHGCVVAADLPADIAKRLLAELQSVEQKIRELEQARCKKGLIDSFMERNSEERDALLALLGRWRLLVLMLQGKLASDPPVPKKPATQADLVALAYVELRDQGRVKAFS